MFKGPGKIVPYNKSSSYPVFELTGVNCILNNILNIPKGYGNDFQVPVCFSLIL